jgi:hypothetical protein
LVRFISGFVDKYGVEVGNKLALFVWCTQILN